MILTALSDLPQLQVFETHVELLMSPCLSVALSAACAAIVELDFNKTVGFRREK